MKVLASDCHAPLALFRGSPMPRLYKCEVETRRSQHYGPAQKRHTLSGFATSFRSTPAVTAKARRIA